MKATKKYQIRKDLTKIVDGSIVYRIEALKDFSFIKKGSLGGWVESENNLSQEGICWVSDNAVIYGKAQVYANAKVWGKAFIHDNAKVGGCALIYDNAEIFEHAKVCGYAEINNNAKVYGSVIVNGYAEIGGNAEVNTDSSYYAIKNMWSSGRYFTYTRSNKMWRVGCFYGTSEQLIEKAYKDSKVSGQCYESVVKWVEDLYRIIEDNK